jgi:phage terminase large subunit-like protein
VLDGCYFDDAAALRAVKFFTRFCHYPAEDGGGRVKLIDWQVYDLIAPLFGWMRPGAVRRYRRGCLWVPKKNGKSFLCSLIALLMLVKPTEPSPEVYVAAGDREQASIVYKDSSKLAKSSPQIFKRVKPVDSRRWINVRKGGGLYRVLSSDAKLAEGIKWSCMILDELHVQRPQMWQTVKGGGVSRAEPLMLAISTAGVYDETSIGWEQWRYSEAVQTGEVDNWSYFALVYAAQKDDDWNSPETWRKANPSFGAVLREDNLRELYEEARDNPSEQPNFKRYHMNMWVQSADIWIGADKWAACEAQYTAEDMDGCRCYAAMDMSQTEDMTALALWFPEQKGMPQRLLEWYFLPGDNLARMGEKNNVPYADWHARGLLKTTPGNYIDADALQEYVLSILSNYHVDQMVFDPYNSASMHQAAEKAGIPCAHFPQTTRHFNEPMKEFSGAIFSRKVQHNGNPITKWQLSNCQVVYDSGGLMKLNKTDGGGVNKRGTKRHKIDGPVAMVMACGAAKAVESQTVGIL